MKILNIKNLKFWAVILTVFAVFMIFTVVKSKAEENEATSRLVSCYGYQLDKDSIYADPELNAEGLMELYHETINNKFNEYIAKMIKASPSDSNAQPVQMNSETGKPVEGYDDQGVPKACQTNYSSYCVGAKLLTDPKFGYLAYRKALLCRKYSIFKDAKDVSIFKDYSDAMIMGKENEKQTVAVYQAAKILEVSAQIEGIDHELESAKRALDQTLTAYNELRMSWPMHKKYKEIYDQLGKYRDKLVDVRHQVEGFPAKFFDVTTTKCT